MWGAVSTCLEVRFYTFEEGGDYLGNGRMQDAVCYFVGCGDVDRKL